MKKGLVVYGCIGVLLLVTIPSFALLNLTPNKDNACYYINEKVLFSITGASDPIDYIIYQDKFTKPLSSGRLERQVGKAEISFNFLSQEYFL
ncbi:MAG: hypothetical protein HC892_10335 [Saprospiraceae bacterium]|nr:hypothetical protein [Saprospiraceae bacterium]